MNSLILVLHRQQNDYIYDMNTYNAISYIEATNKRVVFLSMSIELHSYEEITSKTKGYKKVMLLILPETYSICRALVNDISSNNKEVRVYVYGAMVSVAPNEVLKDIVGLSGVIVGDAEEVIDSMCCENDSNIQNKNNSKIIYGELFDLKKLKNASEALVKYGKVNSHVRINTTNGCLHNCSFCVLNKKYGNGVVNKFTVRDMKDVYNEIIYIYEKHGITSFYINDRNITDAGKQRLFELCSLFENYGVKFTFFAFARADSFNEEDINLLKLMRKNGFIMLDIGIEAGNDSDLSVYNKQISKEKNKEIIKLLERANIGIRINFIMLNPFSTYATLCENYLFLSENKVYIWRNYVSLLKLFFGTQLYKESLKNNLLLEDYSISNVYAYRCNDDFANEYKKYIEWIESEKIDILNNTFKNEKILEDILEIFHLNSSIEEKFSEKLKAIKEQMAYEISQYFSFILDEDVQKAYSEFDNFQDKLECMYFKINIMWNKINKELNRVK